MRPGFKMQQQPPGAYTFLVHTQRLSVPASLPLQHGPHTCTRTHTHPPTRTNAACAPLTLRCIIISSLRRRGFFSLCHPHTRLLTHPPTNTFPPSIHSRAGIHAYLVTHKSTLSLPSTVFQFHFSRSLLLRLSIHPSTPYMSHCVCTHTAARMCVCVCILVRVCPPLPSDDSNKACDCRRWRWGMAPIDDRASDSLAAS